MNTTYKAALFACLTFTSIIQTLDMSPAFANREKEFMEFVFIEGYNQTKATLNAEAKNFLILLGTGFLSYKLYNLNNQQQPACPTSTEASSKKSRESYAETFASALLPEATPANAIKTILVSFIGYKAYKMYQNYISWKASVTVLTNFLENWIINKDYTPESYHEFFNELAEIYDAYGKEAFYDDAADIVSGLQFIIKRTELKVSEVYKKEFENNASESSVFDTPKLLGEMLKHSKEIIKL